MERETGLEPATSSLGSWHSTTELLPLSAISYLAESVRLPRPSVYPILPFGCQNRQHASLRIRPHSPRRLLLMLSVPAVHFALQSSFQAHYSITSCGATSNAVGSWAKMPVQRESVSLSSPR